ncbi:MAG TPA: hypothetical protein VFR03_08465 [Thermoanaerobaculia bacterium]|nr:hypothetical protein [Thermoanaerobaculia bacterium]
MRISRLPALALAGLLGLGGTGAAADKACPEEDSVGSRAVALAECNGGFADLHRLAQVYSRDLGLSPGTAARLAGALADWQALEKTVDRGRGRAEDPAFEPEIRRIESEFIILLNREPDNPRIANEVSWFYADIAGIWSSREPSPALPALVTRSADPARLAYRLAEIGYTRAGAESLFAALAVDPKPAVLWHQAARLTQDPAWKIALLEEAWRRIAAGEGGRPADGEAATALAEELLEAQLDASLASQAAAAFQSLPPAVRSRVEQGAEGAVKTEVGGLPFESRLRDLRLPLAAAYLLAGDPRAASRLIARVEPVPAAKARKDSELQAREAARQFLTRWLRPSPEDPFDLLIAGLAGERLDVRVLALARVAERERYPAFAAYCLGSFMQDRAEPSFPEGDRGAPARVRADAESIRGEIARLRQSLADEAGADREAARTAFGPDPAAATLSRLLSSPAAVRFAERPLPEGVAPVELTDQEIARRQKAMVAGMKLPAGFGLVRAERQGDRAAAIGVSQDYDPVGEVSAGAYWVLLSSDGGRTWEPPLYTGLRVNQPYVARPVSRLPLLAGDHLQMEVEIAELDPAKIYFPPVMLTPKRTAKGLYLDIPLDLLRKDSDGDGLTDLAEERLMTDPQSRDTDGDGLEDGVDPLPAVPFRREAPSASARALAAFLGDTWKADRAAIIEGIPAGPRVLCCVRDGVRTVDEKTLFLIADRGLFSALQPARRVVVLTPEEAEAARRKFGPFYPQKLELFFFDRSGRHAYVIWNASWQGGGTRLDEQPDGTWKATAMGGWIT